MEKRNSLPGQIEISKSLATAAASLILVCSTGFSALGQDSFGPKSGTTDMPEWDTPKPVAKPAPKPTPKPAPKPAAPPATRPVATAVPKPAATPAAKPAATPAPKAVATPAAKPAATPAPKAAATPAAKPAATEATKASVKPQEPPAAKPASSASPSSASSSSSTDPSAPRQTIKVVETPIQTYFKQVTAKIKHVWKQPPGKPRIRIALKINRDGSASEEKVVVSSGNKVHDRTALSAIKKASPFGKMPKGYENDYKIQFEF